VPESDKSEIQTAAIDGVVAELEEALKNASNNEIAVRASAATAKRIFERFKGYKPRILAALDDGTFPASSKDAVFGVFADLIAIVGDAHVRMAEEAGRQKPFAAGLSKALSITRKRAEKQRARAAHRADDEIEEDEYRADLAERREQPEPPKPEPSAPKPEPPKPKARPTPKPVKAQTNGNAPAKQHVAGKCYHCDDDLAGSGTKFCPSCTSHKQRYKKLPSAKALATRRQRNADS
jgi:outer membrane biosynthesis protein TonB